MQLLETGMANWPILLYSTGFHPGHTTKAPVTKAPSAHVLKQQNVIFFNWAFNSFLDQSARFHSHVTKNITLCEPTDESFVLRPLGFHIEIQLSTSSSFVLYKYPYNSRFIDHTNSHTDSLS